MDTRVGLLAGLLLLASPDVGSDADTHTDAFVEDWEESPVRDVEESVGYQRLAWYAAPFGDAGIALLLLSFTVNGFRRIGRAIIRLLVR